MTAATAATANPDADVQFDGRRRLRWLRRRLARFLALGFLLSRLVRDALVVFHVLAGIAFRGLMAIIALGIGRTDAFAVREDLWLLTTRINGLRALAVHRHSEVGAEQQRRQLSGRSEEHTSELQSLA